MEASRIAFLFPGQGAQHIGMGAEATAELPAAKELFDRASEQLGYDLLNLCLEGPADQLDATVHSQPALYVASLAALERLRETDPESINACQAVAGLSLGEYTALAHAGAISFEDGLRVVAERGSAMQDAAEAVPSGMVSLLGMEAEKIETLCTEVRQELPGTTMQIANHLCPGNIVVSGSTEACEKIAELAVEAGAMKAIPLAVAGAFHTPIMQPAVERLSAVLAEVKINEPKLPVISNVDAKSHTDPDEIRELLVKQLVSPVLWEASIHGLLNDHQIEGFYEIGPGRVLRGLLKRINRKLPSDGISA